MKLNYKKMEYDESYFKKIESENDWSERDTDGDGKGEPEETEE